MWITLKLSAPLVVFLRGKEKVMSGSNLVRKTILAVLCILIVSGTWLWAQPAKVALDATQTGEPINPHIYGQQLIEHPGRCFYGCIWVEMLEDSKFYFPITENYDPYKAFIDSPFPVVGASPWQILGEWSNDGNGGFPGEDPWAYNEPDCECRVTISEAEPTDPNSVVLYQALEHHAVQGRGKLREWYKKYTCGHD